MACGVTIMTQRRYPVLVETSEGRKSAGFSAPVTEEPARIALRIRERAGRPTRSDSIRAQMHGSSLSLIGTCRVNDTPHNGYEFPHRRQRSIPTIATRRLCQTLHFHLRLKAEFFLGFGDLGHGNLGKQQHTRYRHRVLETNAYHLSGIDDAGLDQIDVLLACGIEAIDSLVRLACARPRRRHRLPSSRRSGGSGPQARA